MIVIVGAISKLQLNNAFFGPKSSTELGFTLLKSLILKVSGRSIDLQLFEIKPNFALIMLGVIVNKMLKKEAIVLFVSCFQFLFISETVGRKLR